MSKYQALKGFKERGPFFDHLRRREARPGWWKPQGQQLMMTEFWTTNNFSA
jgi:hypothetical protein